MKRFVIFLGVGPFIGYVCVILGVLGIPPNYFKLVEGIPFAYAIGVLPALAAALADWLLRGQRIVVTTLVGGLASAALMISLVPSYAVPQRANDYLVFAAVGAISAAACSWLSGRWA